MKITGITVLLFVMFSAMSSVMAITPAQLQEKIARKEDITIIDIRSSSQYRAGHIPGAINIPVSIIAAKTLPAFENVIVYDSGLEQGDTAQAVASLRKNHGVNADVLIGGYAAWLEFGGLSTGKPGLHKINIEYVTYKDLKKQKLRNMIFVDLRKNKGHSTKKTASAAGYAVASTAKSDDNIFEDFPGVPVVKSPFVDRTSSRQAESVTQESPVYVLIDNGDGSAQKTARMLKAGRNRHVVVLIGGEEMMKRKGRSGLQRTGAGSGLRNQYEKGVKQ